ncbi:hypothetical protein Peur_064842 [Populus x canadensis]
MISQRDRSLVVDGILVQVTTSLRLPSQLLLIHADDVVGAGPLPLSSVPESSSNNLPASRAIGKCGKGTPA